MRTGSYHSAKDYYQRHVPGLYTLYTKEKEELHSAMRARSASRHPLTLNPFPLRTSRGHDGILPTVSGSSPPIPQTAKRAASSARAHAASMSQHCSIGGRTAASRPQSAKHRSTALAGSSSGGPRPPAQRPATAANGRRGIEARVPVPPVAPAASPTNQPVSRLVRNMFRHDEYPKRNINRHKRFVDYNDQPILYDPRDLSEFMREMMHKRSTGFKGVDDRTDDTSTSDATAKDKIKALFTKTAPDGIPLTGRVAYDTEGKRILIDPRHMPCTSMHPAPKRILHRTGCRFY